MVDAEFELATAFAKSIIGTLKTSQVLELYGLYKQATLGDNTEPKPSWYNLTDKQKWEAWTAQRGKDSTRAKKDYIEIINDVNPTWKDASYDTTNNHGWVHHSTMANSNHPLLDEDKTVFDWVKENDVTRLKEAQSQGVQMDLKDSDGLTLLHWAADRGNIDSLLVLLSANVDVNIQDLQGQTALHYAASCGHEDIVQVLLKSGADTRIEDEDGNTAKDVASSPAISDSIS